MLETKPDSFYDHPSKVFHGVCFVLLGFDPIDKPKVLSKLVEGGGVDGGLYGPACTHVIVDKLVYDDPTCVAARSDGKTLVNALWVAHSYDVGMPVDPTSIMYRPLKDLNGIPGAKSLVVCLTGYQGHNRDDIMRMVTLLGANFLKPLVANKVTHLICYKFEGEKYELAKKIKKIKLVNHRWLEDCLKAWEILPETDYYKSGYELEVLEVEAKDSEEEADVSSKQDGGKTISPRQPLNPEQDFEKKQFNSTPSKGLSNATSTNEMAFATGNDTRTFRDGDSGEAPKKHDRTVVHASLGNDLASTSGSVRSPHTDEKRSSTKSYSRKTPRKSISSLYMGDMTSNLSNAPTSKTNKFNVHHGISSMIEQANDETALGCVNTTEETGFCPEESSTFKEKRKMDVSCGSSKSQKTSYNSKVGISEGSEEVHENQVSEATSLISGHVETDKHLFSNNATHYSSAAAGINHPQSSSANISKLISSCSSRKSLTWSTPVTKAVNLEFEQDCNLKDTPQPHFAGSEKASLTSKSCIRDVIDRHNGTSEAPKLQCGMLDFDISPSVTETLEIEKAADSANLDLHADAHTKPLTRKMFSRKSLGSNKRSGKGNTTNLKGSIYLNKSVRQDDPAISLLRQEVAVDHEKFVNSEKLEIVPPVVNVDAGMGLAANDVLQSRNDVCHKYLSMDDETEDPEDNEENQVKEAVGEEKIEEFEPAVIRNTGEEDKDLEKNRSDVNTLAVHSHNLASVDDKVDTNGKKVTCGKRKLGESTDMKNAAKEKITKVKRPLCKIKKITVPFAKKITNLNTNLDAEMDNEDSVPCLAGKTARIESMTNVDNSSGKTKRTESIKKVDKSEEVEKENMPMCAGDQIARKRVGILASNKAARKIKPTTNKTNLDSVQLVEIPKSEPVWFILSGHKLQRKEFQQIIRRLKGKVCRDSHQWSYQATHFIVPDPIRRTEKFFAAAASGRWILKSDYLSASNQAGRLLVEEPYEWHKSGLSEDGTINLEAPRKWRLLKERTGHGAFYGMRIIIYGECIVPPLDTLKRVVKAGDGTILATSPPYTRILESAVDFAIVSPGMPHVDVWVQEFLRHEIPCVLPDYLVEFVCKPGYSLERYVQYNTHVWAEKSYKSLVVRLEGTVEVTTPPRGVYDIPCQVCGARDRGEEMLICGDESGSAGCGIGTHFDCCDPPLADIPEEDWFCPKCSKNKNSKKKPQKNAKKGNRRRVSKK